MASLAEMVSLEPCLKKAGGEGNFLLHRKGNLMSNSGLHRCAHELVLGSVLNPRKHMPMSISQFACLIWLYALSLQCQHWFLRLDTHSHTAMVLRRVVECTGVSCFIDFDELWQFSFLVFIWLFNVGVN
jgi:hypothetical protein